MYVHKKRTQAHQHRYTLWKIIFRLEDRPMCEIGFHVKVLKAFFYIDKILTCQINITQNVVGWNRSKRCELVASHFNVRIQSYTSICRYSIIIVIIF